MAYGTDYQSALAAYNAKSLRDRAALSGFNYGGVDEGGNPIWTRADGSGMQPNTDAGETAAQLVEKNTRFNGQDYFNQLGVIPLDPTLTGDGPTPDSERMTPQQAQAWRDQWARSFNKQGFNFQNFDDYLRHTTGSGHYEDDPSIGRVWVPDQRDHQQWNLDAMGASGQPQGNFIQKGVGNFANGGGIVKTIAGAIMAPAIGDLYSAATGGMGGAGAGVGGGAGGGIAEIPEVYESALNLGAGGSALNPAGTALSLANPYTSPNIGEVYDKAINVGGGGNAINPQPMSWDQLFNKMPTTGNKAVDQLISKAATTGLGAANQAGAGSGGDTTGADQQAAEEARKQALIDQINAMYAPENFSEEEDSLSKAIRGQQGDALKLGYEKAARSTTFDAARRGNVGGSVMADNLSNLNRDNQLGATKIEDAVQSALAGLRSARLASQNNAIGLVNAGSGPEAVSAASTGIKNAIDSAQAAKVPDVTQGLFQNVALSNQAINTGNNTAALGAYINARNAAGGGSLFPLGSGASGRSVPV